MLFRREPTSEAVCAFLDRVIHATHAKPSHLVVDKGPQFWCEDFEDWCRPKGIKPRFGAVGQHGSIAVIERLILTLKHNIAWLTLVPLRRPVLQRELGRLTVWYNRHRPHMTLAGATPDEVYCRQRPANRQPRFEPRPCWPRRSPCARPVTLVKGRAGVRLEMEITIQGGRRHLPIVTLRHAA
jgi:transposase InsO family protein